MLFGSHFLYESSNGGTTPIALGGLNAQNQPQGDVGEVSPLSNAAGQQAPVLTPATAAATPTQGGNPVSIAPNLTVSDADDTNLSGATLTLTNPLDGMNEALAVNTAGTNITAAAYNPTSGQLVLSGTDTLANYQQVLQSATYADSAANPNNATRIITIVVSDGFSSSARETTTVTVNAAAANAPAVQNNQTAPAQFTADTGPMTVNSRATVQDSGSSTLRAATVTIANLEDPGDEVLAADTSGTAIRAAYDPATGVLTLSGTDSVAHYQQVLDSVTYDDTALVPDTTPRILDVEVNDGTSTSLVDSVEIDIDPVSHAPVLAAGASFSLAKVNENDASPAGTFVADLLASASPADAVSEADPNVDLGIAVVGVDDSYGSWQFSTDGGTTWQGFDAPTAANATLLTPDDGTLVRFVPAADFNGTVGSGLRFRLWDPDTAALEAGAAQLGDIDGTTADTTVNGGETAFSRGIGAAAVTVNFVNQAPLFTRGPDITADPDAGAQVLRGWATGISPGAPNEAGQRLTFLVSNNNDLFLAQPAIAPDGTLTFTPAPGAAGTALVTVQLHDNGGTANGGHDTSAAVTFAIHLTRGPAAGPAVVTYQVHPGHRLIVFAGQGLLAGARGDGPLGVALLVGPRHGRLGLEPDGSFFYVPGASFRGHDTFVYEVTSARRTVSGPLTAVLTTARPHGKPVHGHHPSGRHPAHRQEAFTRALDLLFSEFSGQP